MDKIIFNEGDKNLSFNILSYEFPDMSGNKDDYDANWLTIEISYSDNNLTFTEKDNCLLSFELKDFIDSLALVIEGKETGIIETFMEPYLNMALTKINQNYAFQIRFVYDTSGDYWKEVYICEEMNYEDLVRLKEQLSSLYNKFPYRPVDFIYKNTIE